MGGRARQGRRGLDLQRHGARPEDAGRGGRRVRIVFHNELPMATDVHVHGVNVPDSMDGVAPDHPGPGEPGETSPTRSRPTSPPWPCTTPTTTASCRCRTAAGHLLVGDMPLPVGRTIGGDTVPRRPGGRPGDPHGAQRQRRHRLLAERQELPGHRAAHGADGDWVVVHYFNEGMQIHPMHLHRFAQIVFAKDGYPLDQPYLVDTVNVAPGERYSVLVQPTRRAPGSGTATSSTTSNGTTGCSAWSPRWSWSDPITSVAHLGWAMRGASVEDDPAASAA